ncbi:SGNH hydrolase-type esterase domain-containing protein [Durotheca rogersii]|uniref:SGNH hydrolase-type esterase domain-containing protein n=1 Tax=Durotheca rogersii TaxID=419775 RepID=UPI00221F61E9|nr:SGNH hydrolase-type esterase domain-containing protein [Durotheca rogersii]KAI5861563.1 SGNH hydrolase-type esterase domain-containing protein [Durotheca rogersii]
MRAPSLLWAAAAALCASRTSAAALPGAGKPPAPKKTPAFFLAGDSTTAVDGGWGDGLLAALTPAARAPSANAGKSGATTASFVAEGRWDGVLALVRAHAAEFESYVTISEDEGRAREDSAWANAASSQFGHNDQKPQNNVSFETYQANLIRFAEEIRSLGGTPILVSSLTRRVFPAGSEHNATDSLAAERGAALAAAAAVRGALAVDLNGASLRYINAIGRDAAWAYNWGEDGKDTTHLNPHGTVVFGRMVIDLLLRERPRLAPWFVPDPAISDRIWNNLPA